MIFGFTEIIVVVYIFQLIIFSFFLFHKARKKLSSIILAFFFIAQAIGSFNQIVNSQIEYFYNNCTLLIYIGIPFYLLWAPLLFLYVKSYIYSDFSFNWNKDSSLTKTSADSLIKIIDEFMITNKPYLQPSITIKELAEKINVPDRHLSQLINEYKKQNFYDFINSYRIMEVKEILTDPEQKKKRILEILYEAGFNSKASFNLAFKKHTGMTPTKFKNSII